MRVISGPELAVAVSEAGGLGFIGPGIRPSDLESSLAEATSLISHSRTLHTYSSSSFLPIGVGFQTWAGDLTTASRILSTYHPAVVWLFAPRHGQRELDEWAHKIRSSSPSSKIWIQVASVTHALEAAQSPIPPDVLVIQGTDAGGHSLTKGAGIIVLLPEVADALSSIGKINDIPLIAAGGIADSRGAAAALTLGASGVVMGTRFLASREARINPGYQRHVVSTTDGGQTTVRTQLYNHLRGTMNWPSPFDARGLINASWRDHESGMSFEKNKELHDEAIKTGEDAWGEEGRTATYAGTVVGLVNEVKAAHEIVDEVRSGVEKRLTGVLDELRS